MGAEQKAEIAKIQAVNATTEILNFAYENETPSSLIHSAALVAEMLVSEGATVDDASYTTLELLEHDTISPTAISFLLEDGIPAEDVLIVLKAYHGFPDRLKDLTPRYEDPKFLVSNDPEPVNELEVTAEEIPEHLKEIAKATQLDSTTKIFEIIRQHDHHITRIGTFNERMAANLYHIFKNEIQTDIAFDHLLSECFDQTVFKALNYNTLESITDEFLSTTGDKGSLHNFQKWTKGNKETIYNIIKNDTLESKTTDD